KAMSSSARSCALSLSWPMTHLVDRDHDVGCLDHGIGLLPHGELQVLDRLVRDRGGDQRSTNIQDDMRGRSALLKLRDLALDDVPSADLHGRLLLSGEARLCAMSELRNNRPTVFCLRLRNI